MIPIPVPFLTLLIMSLALMLSSCLKTPASPEALAQAITEELRDLDPKGKGAFFDSRQDFSDQEMVLVYHISRQDDSDDPWARRRELHYFFRAAPDDPEAPGGWFLERIGGDYLEYLGVAEGLQFDWDYEFYQTANGSREGIAGLSGLKRAR